MMTELKIPTDAKPLDEVLEERLKPVPCVDGSGVVSRDSHHPALPTARKLVNGLYMEQVIWNSEQIFDVSSNIQDTLKDFCTDGSKEGGFVRTIRLVTSKDGNQVYMQIIPFPTKNEFHIVMSITPQGLIKVDEHWPHDDMCDSPLFECMKGDPDVYPMYEFTPGVCKDTTTDESDVVHVARPGEAILETGVANSDEEQSSPSSPEIASSQKEEHVLVTPVTPVQTISEWEARLRTQMQAIEEIKQEGTALSDNQKKASLDSAIESFQQEHDNAKKLVDSEAETIRAQEDALKQKTDEIEKEEEKIREAQKALELMKSKCTQMSSECVQIESQLSVARKNHEATVKAMESIETKMQDANVQKKRYDDERKDRMDKLKRRCKQWKIVPEPQWVEE